MNMDDKLFLTLTFADIYAQVESKLKRIEKLEGELVDAAIEGDSKLRNSKTQELKQVHGSLEKMMKTEVYQVVGTIQETKSKATQKAL